MNLLVDAPANERKIAIELKVAFICSLIVFIGCIVALGYQITIAIQHRMESWEKQGTVVGYRVDRFQKQQKAGE